MIDSIDLASHRILVVDDNPAIHEDFRKILCPEWSSGADALNSILEEVFGDVPAKPAARRFEMDSAFQGQEALTKVRIAEQEGRPYSMAFMDVRMPPGWDGVETIKHIWKEYPQIQVVICTAYSDHSWSDILKHLGETDSLIILKKPFDNVEALQLAHALTKKWAVTRKANMQMAELNETVRMRTRDLVDANRQLEEEIQRRSQVESDLRKSEARFRQAFETVAVPLAICTIDTFEYLDVNQSFLELCGCTREALLGPPPQSLAQLTAPGLLGQIVQDIGHGEKVRNREISIGRKDGEVRQTLASVETLSLGPQPGLLAVFLDVTAQRNLEGQLRQSQKMEAIGQLAAGVAHDFNNLLTIIQGYASLQLAKANLDADIAKAFSQVRMASDRAAALTRQLLTFSRRQVVQRKPMDLEHTLVRMKSLLCRTLGETIRVEYRLTPGLPGINADESNLDQVIMNLALNARDAMPGGGHLLLATDLVQITATEAAGNPDKRPGSFVRIAMKDSGCGMDEKTLSRIFEPFFTTKPIGRGAGLGLSTVYGIIKQHEGWIDVESQPGAGATFAAFLPTLGKYDEAGSVPLEIECPERVGLSERLSGKGILVVEDEIHVRELITSLLTRNGYQVMEANTGTQALEQWNDTSDQIQLLITDTVMPGGLSGTMLARQLKRRNPDLRVLYTSGYSPDAAVGGDVLEEGVNFLSKPFSQEHFLATVHRALGSRV